MKFLLSLSFLLTLISLTLTRNISWGRRSYNDHLLYRENVIVYPTAGSVQEYYVSYPRVVSLYN